MPESEDKALLLGSLHHHYRLPPLFGSHSNGDMHPGQAATSLGLPGGAGTLHTAAL